MAYIKIAGYTIQQRFQIVELTYKNGWKKLGSTDIIIQLYVERYQQTG